MGEVDRKLTLYKKNIMSDELKRFLSKPLEERRKDADRLREKYPDKVPVIVQVAKSSEIPQTRKPKYLMPKSISIGKVQTILRDYLKDQDFDESKALFICQGRNANDF